MLVTTAKQFKTWRGSRAMTRRDAAKVFGVSPLTIKAWELERYPIPKHISKMIELLNKSTADEGP